MSSTSPKLSSPFNGPEGQEDMPYLLTPGPLTTSRSVKMAMMADWGSRDMEFRALVASIRSRLLRIANCGPDYECVIMQGSGTFAIEAALGSFAPEGKRKTLVAINGAYGQRAAHILDCLGRIYLGIDKGDSAAILPEDIARFLDADRNLTHVFLVHCETTSGIVNPIDGLAREAKSRGRTVILDAMSSFGALPLEMPGLDIDVMVSSSNKCIEGVPGFSYVLCKRALLEKAKGRSHSLVLDLYEQWQGLEKTGQFRFTPPTHALAAFDQALKEHEAEGGVEGRGERYRQNAETLVRGMRKLGFKTLLADEWAGPIIQTFLTPRDPHFDFETFYTALRRRGFAIYPGKLTKRPSFRVGTIGKLDEQVMASAVDAIAAVLDEMQVTDLTPAEFTA